MPDDDRHTGDLLIGGNRIADFVNTLVDPGSRVTPQVVYAWAERQHLPTGRIGSRLTASKSEIRQFLFRRR
jgi:hypothetical protein